MLILLFVFFIALGWMGVPAFNVWLLLLGLFLVPVCFELCNVAHENTVDLATGSVDESSTSLFKEVQVSEKDYTCLGRDAKDIAGLPTLLSSGFVCIVFITVAVQHWC
jgi:diacylglycerol kinase